MAATPALLLMRAISALAGETASRAMAATGNMWRSISTSSRPNDRAITETMSSRESPSGRRPTDPAGAAFLGEAVGSARQFALDQGLGTRDRAHICIIVEELVANLIDYGGRNGDPEISLEFARVAGAVTLVIYDNGRPFDPRNAPAKANVPVRGGGAGLRLVSAWSEIVSYGSDDGRNRLEVNMPLTGA
jgi:anti-sigma regulatory factor (Ser/Thr protein kinase)